MLRITDVVDTRSDGRTTWTLEVEGSLDGEWVPELRRAWRRVQEAAPGAAIRVHLADVRFVDAAGKALLADMYRAGVDIVARDFVTTPIRDDIVRRAAADQYRRMETPVRPNTVRLSWRTSVADTIEPFEHADAMGASA
jgi:ABC-type transporter Mla MlaB component